MDGWIPGRVGCFEAVVLPQDSLDTEKYYFHCLVSFSRDIIFIVSFHSRYISFENDLGLVTLVLGKLLKVSYRSQDNFRMSRLGLETSFSFCLGHNSDVWSAMQQVAILFLCGKRYIFNILRRFGEGLCWEYRKE